MPTTLKQPSGCDPRSLDEASGCDAVRHVLVVDDDLCIRRGLRIRLEGAGYKVSTAENGTEGILFFDEKGADLIILDVKMPDIDGFEVCKSVKEKQDDVPVIFLTGAQHRIIRDYLPQMVEAVGGDFFMRKPFDARLLMKLVSEILNGKR